MNFLISWAIIYAGIKFAMSFDNYMWIPADRKWFHTKEWKPHFKPLITIKNREYFLIPQSKKGWSVIKNRVKDVLTHPYDIIPGIITSLILNIIFRSIW